MFLLSLIRSAINPVSQCLIDFDNMFNMFKNNLVCGMKNGQIQAILMKFMRLMKKLLILVILNACYI